MDFVFYKLCITVAAWLWTCFNNHFPVKLHHKYTNKFNVSSIDECKAKAKLLLAAAVLSFARFVIL